MNGRRRRGRPRVCPDDVLELIVAMNRNGITYRSICSELNANGVPTPAGRQRWYPSYVSRLLNTANVVERFGRPSTSRRSARPAPRH
ncbi:recombinase family protein [Nocardia sp. XZ_19_385]|uniref:recombinase family protein n=1 Tax=Nocardia sp. XZ_19_385 TaxID=2769488 RepID=UPI00188FA73A|nr:recombinase family protein [Nocardia sp. XZ_19_385]